MLNSIILGIIQGLTEFLPVSSSGHLVIFSKYLSPVNNLNEQIFFDIMVHVGTLFSVLIIYRKKIIEIIKNRDFKYILYVFIAMIPTGMFGILFKDYFENVFSIPKYAATMLIFTGFLLLLTKYKKSGKQSIDSKNSFLIGIMQGLAIIPGISRSGATISSAIFLNVDRKRAGTFSFLLSIPAILAALCLKSVDMLKSGSFETMNWTNVFFGSLSSFLIGIFALKLLLRFVENGRLYYFSFYCFAIGLIGFVLL